MFFFHFVSQEELIVSKMIIMPCTFKIDGEDKIELADNITERCQRYKMNRQSVFINI